MSSLLDGLLPRCDFHEHHEIAARAEAADAYAALRSADLGGPVVRVLFALRSLPALLTRGRAAPAGRLGLENLLRLGFALLGEDPPRELVFGVAGRPWSLRPQTLSLDAASFRKPLPPGTVRVATNFVITPQSDGIVRISTETRIACADAAARRRFGLYWLAIRAGSGLIRRAWLRSIRTEAERLARTTVPRAGSSPSRSR